MDVHKLIARYNQFGGFRLIIEYAKLGVLGVAIKGFFRCLVKKESFRGIYPEVLRRIEPFLVERYAFVVQEFKSSRGLKMESLHQLRKDENRKIWFCWLQGLENAPEIVIACYNSLRKIDREIIVVDAQNWKEYVVLPDYIVEKWEKKLIPAALFSDLLRLELLIKYGGSWIDSTVLCTGLNRNETYLDAVLFLFQYTNQGRIPVSVSNWFITACANNEVLIVLRRMLHAYWKDYDCTLDYYIFHLFFSVVSKEYPNEVLSMPYGNSQNSLMLLHHWGEKYDPKKWDNLTCHVNFHKLTFRVNKNVIENKDNYYNHILSEYGRI